MGIRTNDKMCPSSYAEGIGTDLVFDAKITLTGKENDVPGVLLRSCFDEWTFAERSETRARATVAVCFATTEHSPTEKADRLKRAVMDAHQQACDSVPADHRFIIKIMSFPEVGIVRTEYGSLCFLVCDEIGLEVYAGSWIPVPRETARVGVVVAGAMHPILPATRYRLMSPVERLFVFSTEPQHVDREPSRMDAIFHAKIDNNYEKAYQERMTIENADYPYDEF